MANVINASFSKSLSSLSQVEADDILEVCFIGRSNVGKSSLINLLTNQKKLAKKSSTPGKTRLINLFDIIFKEIVDDEVKKPICRFVDLPGLGYAKVSKDMKKDWDKNISNYIEKRENIKIFVYLVDSRHKDLEIDKKSISYFTHIVKKNKQNQILLIVYTKSDKINKNEIRNIKLKNPECLLVSHKDRNSIDELSNIIYDVLFNNEYK